MSGLTQADVTPNAVVEEEEEQQKDEGYRLGRWFSNPGNELRFIGNGIRNLWNDTEKRLLEASNTPGVKSVNYIALPGMPPVPITEKDDGTVSASSPTAQEIVAGAQEATVDVPLQAISVGQQSFEQIAAPLQGRPVTQTDTRDFEVLGIPGARVGQLLEDSKDQFAEFMGVDQRFELGDRSIVRDMSSNVTSSIYTLLALSKLGLTPGARPTAFTGMRANPFVSAARPAELSKVPGIWGAYWRANPKWAQTAAQWLSFGGLESFGTTLLSDQTQAGFADPGDSQATATFKSFLPNALQELALGSLFFVPGAAVSATSSIIEGALNRPSSIARTRRAAGTLQEVKNARQWTKDSGLQAENPDGTYEFVAEDPWSTGPVSDTQVRSQIDSAIEASDQAPPASPRQALDQMEGRARVEMADAWDPALPEIDTAKRALDRVEPADLPDIAAEVADGTPLTESLGRRLDAAEAVPEEIELGQPVNFPPDVAMAMFMAYDLPTLRAMAANNPGVAQLLRANNLQASTAARTELTDALTAAQKKGQAISAPQRVPETAVDPAQADALKGQILRTAADSGQVRPSTTQAPEIPQPPAKDPSDMTAVEQLLEEDRLQGEWTRIDNAKAQQATREAREADGYYQKSEAEQADAGKYDGWDEADPMANAPTVARAINEAKIEADAQILMRYVPEVTDLTQAVNIIRRKGRVLNTDKISSLNDSFDKVQNDMVMGRSTPEVKAYQKAYRDFYGLDAPEGDGLSPMQRSVEAAVARGQATPPAPAPTQQFTLPADVAKSKPRFGMAKLTFASDLDRAAYIIRNKAKASKGEARIVKALEEQGYDIAEIRARGDEVKALIQDVIEEQTGSRRAPQSAMELEIPDTDGPGIRDDSMMSVGGPELPPIGEAERLRMTAALEQMATQRVSNLEESLKDVARQLFGEDLPVFKLRRDPETALVTKAWGGDGKRTSEIGGRFFPLQDVVQINNLANTPLTGINGLREIMAHESWHRIQAGYLTPKESKVLSNVFGKQDLEFFGMPFKNDWGVQPIEIQALAFQRYFTMKEQGLSRVDLLRDGIAEALDKQFPRKGGRSWRGKLTVDALAVLAEGWERIIAFYNRSMNFIEGNGFRNVYDLFEDAYQGRLTAERKMESFLQVTREAEQVMRLDRDVFDEFMANNPDFEERVTRASIRQDYWDLWKGKANKSIAKIDSDIAALKQQAIAGGC